MKVRAVATDLDGTLTGGQRDVLSPIAIKAVATLEERGVPVILASGNCFPVLRTLSRYLGCTGPVVCECGGVVSYRNETTVLGSKDQAEKALKELKKTHSEKIVEVWSTPYHLGNVALRRTIEKEELLKVLESYPSLKLIDSGYAYHILEKAVNKGQGLKMAASLMGLETSEIVAVGDSEVDMEMLQVSGFGIAIANSPAALKAVASHVTKGSNGRGFAEAVRLILSGKI